MAYSAGVDVGSTQTKAVIIDENRKIVGRALTSTGADVVFAAQDCFAKALQEGGLQEADIGYVIGTGYGRYRVTFGDTQITEISCHGRGAVHMFPNTKTVVDMGGQDTKAIKVSSNGEIDDFCMNDKCAAGTGRFLGAASMALDIPLDNLGPTALKYNRPVKITTTCTVFAESEILSWLGKGKKVEDILWGVHQSIASRSAGLMRRVGIADEITFTGGVARNVAMVQALEERLGKKLNVSDDSHFMGALGAALFALDHIVANKAATTNTESTATKEDRVMPLTAGIDVGSTYTKSIIINEKKEILACDMRSTGFKLKEVAKKSFAACLEKLAMSDSDIDYIVATGIGRHQVDFKDLHVTDITAAGRGACQLFPNTRTVLDIGGQTMKSSRLDENKKVISFRLNDKCAAGTGAFLEKTASYMGFSTAEINPLLEKSKEPVPISGVCAVFAESEVINHLSLGSAPADIMQGSIESLINRALQLIKRVKGEKEYTLVGGIMRFETMGDSIKKKNATGSKCATRRVRAVYFCLWLSYFRTAETWKNSSKRDP